jgi:hypothetical protein
MLRILASMMLRRWYAVAVAFVFVAAAGVYIHTRPVTYQQNVTLVLLSPSNNGKGATNTYVSPASNVFNDFSDTLPPTGLVLTEFFDNADVRNQVQTSDGEIRYSLSMTNGYNQQYPRYDQPTMQLIVRGSFPTGVEQTTESVLSVAAKELAAIQSASGSAATQLITLKPIYESAPLLANGRPARVEAGLLIAFVGWSIGLVLLAERWALARKRDDDEGTASGVLVSHAVGSGAAGAGRG